MVTSDSGPAAGHDLPGRPAAATKAFIASWVGWMFDGYESFAFVLVMPVVLREFLPEAAPGDLSFYGGIVIAAMLVGWATGGVIAGVVADYVGRKQMLMLSILWYALCAGATAFAPNYAWLVALRFLTGMGLGAEWGSGAAIVAEFWPPAWRGRAAGLLQSGFGAGFFLASGLWLFIAPLGPSAWRYMFLFGALPALCLLYIRRNVQESPLWLAARERRRAAQQRVDAGPGATVEDRELARFTISALLADPVLRRRIGLLVLMSLTTVVGWWSVSTWIPQFVGQAAQRAGLDPQRWSALSGLTYNAGAIAGYVVFGVLADVWGRKPAIKLYYAGSLLLSFALFLLVDDPVVLLVVAAANGFFTLGQFSWMAVYLPELFETAVRGSAISLVFNVSRYVAALGPLAAGWIIASTGGIAGPAAVMSLVYVIGWLVTPSAGPETRGLPLPK